VLSNFRYLLTNCREMEKLLWTPTQAYKEHSTLFEYQQYIADKYAVNTANYAEMHAWSINNLSTFWESILTFFDVKYSGTYDEVFTQRGSADDFTQVSWFAGIDLSYSENIFLNKDPNAIAVKYADEDASYTAYTWSDLSARVSSLHAFLRENNIQQGDRVVGLLNNTVEALVIFL